MNFLVRNDVPYFMKYYLGYPDERVVKWPLLNSPMWFLTLLPLYGSILLAGRNYMRNRKAFKLRGPLIIYNVFQVISSAYVCKEIFCAADKLGYNINCSEISELYSEHSMRMARGFWLFYITKYIDLIDTIFFVFRKKKNQLTFLHVYHHCTMVFNWYLGVLYLPGGQAYFSVMFNSFVHVIMYTYYLLSAFGPHVQKYLWWKKYITQLQLIQFIACIAHILLGYKNKCRGPYWLTNFTICYLLTLVALFVNFYIKAYLKRKTARKVEKITSVLEEVSKVAASKEEAKRVYKKE